MVQASCPGCGSSITFKLGSSVVLVCEFCRSVVARGDRNPKDLGKVAYLVTTDSLLSIGSQGRYQGEPFELTGRAQFSHEVGGVWNEWYASFPNDRWGWLVEAQGRFYLTFQRSLADSEAVEPFASLALGALVFALSPSSPLTVTEKGIALTVSAEGEIPYRFVPGVEHRYADLSGPHGEFVTLDYSEDPPLAFVGYKVAFAELGFLPTDTPRAIPQVKAQQLSCPNCASALSLRAPDHTERVTCPSCGSLLDINQGNLKFLRVLDQKVTPVIPLGAVGHFDRHPPLTVIGCLQRSVEVDGIRYFWEEYLLYASQLGCRWLIHRDDHWNFVTPLPSGKVTSTSREARYNKRNFALFQDAVTRVEHILGEFYWRVDVGETIMTADYIAPPLMLSREVSVLAQKTPSETNWSLGEYLAPQMIEKAFNLRDLPRPWKIAPNQPYPHREVYEHWLQFSLLAVGLAVVLFLLGAQRHVMQQTYQLEPIKGGENSAVRFSDPFTLQPRQNVEISVTAPLNGAWLDLVGDLINQQTDDAQGFSLVLESVRDSEDRESRTEGSRVSRSYLSAPEAGAYILGFDAQWDRNESQPMTFTVTIRQGVPRPRHLVVALLALSVVPLFVLLRHYYFERQRWNESIYNPHESNHPVRGT
jgi:ribosomal protein S27AE